MTVLKFLKSKEKDPRDESLATGVCFVANDGSVSGIAADMADETPYFSIAKKCTAVFDEGSETLMVRFLGVEKTFLCAEIGRSEESVALTYYGEEADNFFQGLLAKGRSCFDCGSIENLRQCPQCAGTNTLCVRCFKTDHMCRDCRSLELIYHSRSQEEVQKKTRKPPPQNTIEITKTKAWKKLRKALF